MCATYISRRFQTRNACNVTVSQDILQFLANFGGAEIDVAHKFEGAGYPGHKLGVGNLYRT